MENQLKQDLKAAQLARDEVRVSTLRLLLSELTYLRVYKGLKNQEEEALADSDVISVVQREIKKRREATEGFRKGGNEEGAQKEESELKILEAYLPAQLSNEELTKVVEDSITELGAKTIQDMGRVMGVVMGKVGQNADGSSVSALVKQKLSL